MRLNYITCPSQSSEIEIVIKYTIKNKVKGFDGKTYLLVKMARFINIKLCFATLWVILNYGDMGISANWTAYDAKACLAFAKYAVQLPNIFKTFSQMNV